MESRQLAQCVCAPILLAPAFLTACFLVNDDPDGGYQPDGGADASADSSEDSTPPINLPACPADQPHLVVGADGVYDAEPALYRFDSELAPCRGVALTDYPSLSTVAGSPSGEDLVGMHEGVIAIAHGSNVTTRPTVERTEDLAVRSLFRTTFEGATVLVAFWIEPYYGSSGEVLELLQPNLTAANLPSYDDLPSSVEYFGPAPNGEADRLGGALTYDGVRQYQVVRNTPDLGTTDELRIPAPSGAGELNWLDVVGDRAVVAANKGILYWTQGQPAAFLGPVECRWAARAGTLLPDRGRAEYISVTPDIHSEEHFLAIVDGTIGDESGRTALYRISTRGECELLLLREGNVSLEAVAWSGPIS